MSMEGLGDIGPSGLNRVPDRVKPTLNSEGYRKPPFIDIVNMTFSDAERKHLAEVSAAKSIPELREAIDAFNKASTPKLASGLGISLDVMEIVNQPIQTQELEGFEGASVVLNRTMQGIATMDIKS